MPQVPVWYRNSAQNQAYVGGYLPTGDPATREKMAQWAVYIAEKYPKMGFCYGEAYYEEFQRIVDRLGLKPPEQEMTDETCVHCLHPRQPNKDRANENIYTVQESRKKWKSQGSGNKLTREELASVEI